jgi:hypothetical protein
MTEMKRMSQRYLSSAILLIVALAGVSCSNKPASNSTNAPQGTLPASSSSTAPSTANAVHVKYSEMCQKENKDKVVSVDGYFGTNDLMVSCSGAGEKKRCTLNLMPKPGSTESHSASVSVGSGPNQMDALPAQYTAEDLHLRTSDGKAIGPRDRVRVVGKMYVTDDYCSIDVLEIQTPPADSKPEEAEVKAEEVAFADACKEENKGKTVAVEGYLGVSSIMFCKNRGIVRYCGLNLYPKPGTGDGISANVDVGTEANQMEQLPEQYKPEDLKIHTSDGKTIGFRDRVKISGKVTVSGTSCWIDVSEIKKL